jgi:hypothetical protein
VVVNEHPGLAIGVAGFGFASGLIRPVPIKGVLAGFNPLWPDLNFKVAGFGQAVRVADLHPA